MLKVIITLVLVFERAELNPQLSFATASPTTRAAGRIPMCVPINTCAAAMAQAIEPRILTTNDPPVTCNAGQVLCLGILGGEANCGVRYGTVSLGDGQAQRFAHPWQAYIKNGSGYTGSGVLLDSTHVLTAAHKVYQYTNNPGALGVFLGVHNPPTLTNISMIVRRVKVHESFNTSTLKNDIAILTLKDAVPLGYRKDVGTLCLPAEGSSNGLINTSCMVAGWGMTAFQANDAPKSPQKQVSVNIVSYNTCFQSMSRPDVLGSNAAAYLDDKELCAGGVQNKDACTDGGAPLTCNVNGRYTAAGLVIWGKGCGRPGVYGVYVDVAKYLPWIRTNLV